MTHHKKISKSDNFYTPKWMVDVLTSYVDFSCSIVWECAAGEGHIACTLRAKLVLSSDITRGIDFLKNKHSEPFDYIVTNPPFSLKTKFLEKALSYNVPVCMLLPIPCLGNKSIQRLLKGVQLIIPNKRCNFIGSGNAVAFSSAWFCFGCNLHKDLIFHEV